MKIGKITLIGKRHWLVKMAIILLLFLSLPHGVLAESSGSGSYRLDYSRFTSDSDQKSSASYQLTDSVSDMSAEGSSSNFQLRNLYAESTAGPVCGNGIKEVGEQCDGGDFGGLTCGSYGFNQGNLQCVACTIIANACSNSGGGGGGGGIGFCGNGIKNANEQCDDGNIKSGDGCDTSCKVEKPLDEPKESQEELQEEPQEKPEKPKEKPTSKPKPNEPSQQPAEPNLDLLDPASEPQIDSPKQVKDAQDMPQDDNEQSDVLSEQELATQLHGVSQEEFGSSLQTEKDAPEAFHMREANMKGDAGAESAIVMLDETPLFAAKIKPNHHYELRILNESDEIVVRQGVTSDQNGVFAAEVANYLDYGKYRVLILDGEQKTVKEWTVIIEDPPYRSHENLSTNEAASRETISLGELEELKKLSGKGKPFAVYHAYLETENNSMPVVYLTTTADANGNYELTLPQKLTDGSHILHVVQVYDDGKISRNLRYFFMIKTHDFNFIYLVLGGFFLLMVLLLMFKDGKKNPKKIKKVRKTKLVALALIILFTGQTAEAAVTTPPVFVYEGKLLDAANNPVVSSQSFRFSFWQSDDVVAGDVLGDGSLNAGAPNYGGWQEVHTLTPNVDGTFFVELGSNSPLPDMNIANHLHLQVEIKAAIDPNTSYELMDPTGDNGADANDRQTIGSTPYTNNADFLDNAEVGTSMGDIATLGFGNMWDINYIPGGTNVDSFTLDSDNTAGPGDTIDLVFGNALAETIRFDINNDWFDFSNDINLNQHQIKNVAIDNLPNAPGAPVNGQIYHNTTDGNTYIWNGVIWEDITAGVGGISVQTASFNVEYSDATVQADGTSNRGTLSSHFVDGGGVDKYNYYEWATSESALQDNDIILSYRLPLDFISFTANPLNILYQTTDGNAANNRLDIELHDTTGAPVALVGGSGLANPAWTTQNITFGGVPTFTPGETITLKIKLSALDPNFARVSNINLNYNAN